MSRIYLKLGDTFSAALAYKFAAPGEVPVYADLTGVSVRAQVRKVVGNALVSSLVYTMLTQDDPPPVGTLGKYTLSKAYDDITDGTALWPIGIHRCDIEYTFTDGSRSSTETFEIEVLQDVTA